MLLAFSHTQWVRRRLFAGLQRAGCPAAGLGVAAKVQGAGTQKQRAGFRIHRWPPLRCAVSGAEETDALQASTPWSWFGQATLRRRGGAKRPGVAFIMAALARAARSMRHVRISGSPMSAVGSSL